MSKGSLLKISVAISAEAEDAVAEVLREVLREPGSVYHDLELNTFTASVYLPNVADWNTAAQRDLKTGLARVRTSGLDLGPDNGRVTVEKVKREDWAESWKRHFKPIAIGTALLVKPSWVKRAPRKGQAVVVLDPGLSFGTGQHPTTRFCLGQLVAAVRAGRKESFLDVGTGSGILAISAAKLGFEVVEAFDFDPESIRVAKVNAAKNRTTKRMRLSRGDLTRLPLKSRRKYQVVCANLIYDLLLAERTRILNRLAPKGTLVLAGILRTQFAEVRAAYESAGLHWVAGRVENEWESGAFVWA
jgi:ribosomal protein L11 methyltransferase